MSVSLAMLVKDPPLDRMALLLEYVRPVVGQVVVVIDDRTSIEAVEILQTWDVECVPFRWIDDFAAARNTALPFIKGDWTLHLDPDELPSHAMLDFIRSVDAEEQPDRHWANGWYPAPRGYLFWTVNFYGGMRSEGREDDWHCRLFQTRYGRWYKPVHECVALDGEPEAELRGTPYLVKAPQAAKLIHSKPAERVEPDHELYARLEAVA